jgi:hypothetical protein
MATASDVRNSRNRSSKGSRCAVSNASAALGRRESFRRTRRYGEEIIYAKLLAHSLRQPLIHSYSSAPSFTPETPLNDDNR